MASRDDGVMHGGHFLVIVAFSEFFHREVIAFYPILFSCAIILLQQQNGIAQLSVRLDQFTCIRKLEPGQFVDISLNEFTIDSILGYACVQVFPFLFHLM